MAETATGIGDLTSTAETGEEGLTLESVLGR